MRVDDRGRMVIEPVVKRGVPLSYKLEDLLAGITDENRHDEVDFGPSVGREVF